MDDDVKSTLLNFLYYTIGGSLGVSIGFVLYLTETALNFVKNNGSILTIVSLILLTTMLGGKAPITWDEESSAEKISTKIKLALQVLVVSIMTLITLTFSCT